MVVRRFGHDGQSLYARLLFNQSKQILCRVPIFRCFNRCALCSNASLLKRASRPTNKYNISRKICFKEATFKNERKDTQKLTENNLEEVCLKQ